MLWPWLVAVLVWSIVGMALLGPLAHLFWARYLSLVFLLLSIVALVLLVMWLTYLFLVANGAWLLVR